MKKISFILSFVLIALLGCEKEETRVTIYDGSIIKSEITSLNDGFTKVITEGTLGESITFDWTLANYGVNTQITYSLEIDSLGRNFSAPQILGETTGSSLALTLDDINSKLLTGLKVTPNEASSLELRIVSSIGGQAKKSSEVISITVTPWKQNIPSMLWVPGEYQGWNPGAAPTITEVSEGKFEGYVNISSATGYKFTSAPDWDHINYGDSGTLGVLTTDGLANGMGLGTPGYYKFNVDVGNLTYSAALTETWGMVGTATPGVWDISSPLTFNAVNNTWSATIDLVNGALKFRANDGWDINFGPADTNALVGTLIQTDNAISIPETGTYTVTIDLSKSKAPYMYQYKVVKN